MKADSETGVLSTTATHAFPSAICASRNSSERRRVLGESVAPRSSISYASRHAHRASRSSGRGGRHTTVPLESGSGTTSCDRFECVQPLGSIHRHIGAIEFQFRPCLTYLFERSRQARDRTSAPFHGSACQFSRVFRRLQQEHAVPAVCRDTDHTVVAKGTRVVSPRLATPDRSAPHAAHSHAGTSSCHDAKRGMFRATMCQLL